MSNFDFGIFCGDENIFAVSKSKCIEIEADELFVQEIDIPLSKARRMSGWVYYGIGFNEDHERVSGYWFSTEPHGRYPQECWAYIY